MLPISRQYSVILTMVRGAEQAGQDHAYRYNVQTSNTGMLRTAMWISEALLSHSETHGNGLKLTIN
jgi:hypothetical protein